MPSPAAARAAVCRSRILVVALLASAATAILPASAMAQRWQLDLGASRVRYDTSSAISTAYLTPQLEFIGSRVYFGLSGTAAQSEGGQFSGAGLASLSGLVPLSRGPSGIGLQLSGNTGGTTHESGYRSASTAAGASLYWSGARLGVWAGANGNWAWASTPGTWIGAFQPSIGVWARPAPFSISASWAPSRLEGWWFNQVHARASVSTRQIDLEGYAGWRSGPMGSGIRESSWAGADAVLWLTRSLAVTAGGGSYPSDLLQGLPRGRFISVGIRLASRRLQPVPANSNEQLGLFQSLRHRSEGGAVFHLRIDATRVDVVGDWNGWQPEPLQREPGGRWLLRVLAAPGTYRYSLILDGDRWALPEGVEQIDDGFGGKVGVMVLTE